MSDISETYVFALFNFSNCKYITQYNTMHWSPAVTLSREFTSCAADWWLEQVKPLARERGSPCPWHYRLMAVDLPCQALTDWSLVSPGFYSRATNYILEGAAEHRLSGAITSTV